MTDVEQRFTDECVTKKNTLKVYFAGGCGINIATATGWLEDGKFAQGFSDLDCVLVDTSKSNLLPHVDERRFFLVENASEGSGGLRSENYLPVKQDISRLISTRGFEPSNFNAVVFSASGGSGSVISPLLIEELLRQNKVVVAVIVVPHTSAVAARNAKNVILGLNNTAKLTGLPVVCHLVKSDSERFVADEEVKHFISELSFLVSNQHLELDNMDVTHLLHYTKKGVTTAQPTVASLDCLFNPDNPKDITNAISVAEIHTDRRAELAQIKAEYSCNGFLRVLEDYIKDGSYYYVVSTQGIEDMVKFLENSEAEYTRVAQSHAKLTLKEAQSVEADTGLVL